MSKRVVVLMAVGWMTWSAGDARAGTTVAVIDAYEEAPGWADFFCAFLEQNDHPCTTFPTSGPTGPLGGFDVVIDMSESWTDPAGELADLLIAGKTVITWGDAPLALGINSNPTVQAWIGANQHSGGDEDLITTASDPLLGDIPPGTKIYDASTSFQSGVRDSSGHPQAQVLAVWVHMPQPKPIGVMRNFWGNGASVYLSDAISPGGDGIVLNAVRIQQLIPTTSDWGLLTLVLGLAIAGTLILRRRGVLRNRVAGDTLCLSQAP